jgi:hypothetical protein
MVGDIEALIGSNQMIRDYFWVLTCVPNEESLLSYK